MGHLRCQMHLCISKVMPCVQPVRIINQNTCAEKKLCLWAGRKSGSVIANDITSRRWDDDANIIVLSGSRSCCRFRMRCSRSCCRSRSVNASNHSCCSHRHFSSSHSYCSHRPFRSSRSCCSRRRFSSSHSCYSHRQIQTAVTVATTPWTITAIAVAAARFRGTLWTRIHRRRVGL